MEQLSVNMKHLHPDEPLFDPDHQLSILLCREVSQSGQCCPRGQRHGHRLRRRPHQLTRAPTRVIEYVKEKGLKVEWLIETHVHADHLSGAPYIQEKLGGKIGIGENIITVQDTFGKIFNEGTEVPA